MHNSPPASVRYLVISVVALLAIAALYPLTIRLAAQLHISSAEKRIIASDYIAALSELHKAVGLQPNEFRIHNELGNVYYKLASKDQENNRVISLLDRAKDHFQQALSLHPLDARSAYGLARTEILIEKINYLSGKGVPFRKNSPALMALEQAIALRPASTIYRLAYARYLYLHNATDKLLSQMRILGSLQPSLHGILRGETFWSSAPRLQFFTGVKQALANAVTLRQSLFVASALMAEEKNWAEAIGFRQQGMAVQSSLNRAADFIQLGYLYLVSGEPDKALEYFNQALPVSEDIEKDIISIMKVCKNAASPESLVSFYGQAGKLYGNSSRMDIAAARYLLDLKNYERAKNVLHESNKRLPYGETYYWISRIAEVEQDWDAYEVAIQKATLHDPHNTDYHLRLSQVLNRLQKYDRAEKEAGLAIQYSAESRVDLYTHRAGLRMRLQDFTGGLEDWRQALEIEPQNAANHYQAGDALEKMSRIDEAAEYYQKAIELEPGNRIYARRLESIVKKYGVKK